MNYKERAVELFNNGMLSKTEIAKQISQEFDMPMCENLRKYVSLAIKKSQNLGVFTECEEVGIDPTKVKHYWYKGKNYSINVKGENNDFNYEDFKEDLIAEISKWSPKYPEIKRTPVSDPHCLVFSPADIHIGKLCSSFETGEEYNQQIAVKRVKEGLDGIIRKAH